ncbi:hypothetical protein [Thiospirillum jenense]|uniref:Uncharacterized protein n=1 Tax=Thiospirillum jenense TaxID=1653858 RepID=A0A839H336_9GAMM|nr:hypothetical protein [Thiospirillum jenense]MBB1124805.1 hypothetical protein [Thiospirillum jenense]
MIYNGIKRRANTVKVTTEVRRGRDWQYAHLLIQVALSGNPIAHSWGRFNTQHERIRHRTKAPL